MCNSEACRWVKAGVGQLCDGSCEPADVWNISLIKAAEKIDRARVEKLLAAGASAAFVQNAGLCAEASGGSGDVKTALHGAIAARVAAPKREDRLVVIHQLLAAGADANARRSSGGQNDGARPARTAFEMAMPEAVKNLELMKAFLDAGADPNVLVMKNVRSSSKWGGSVACALHTAVRTHRLDVATALLDAGANVDAVELEHLEDDDGVLMHREEMSLHIACGAGDAEMTKLLLERGGDVNAMRKDLEQQERRGSHVKSKTARDAGAKCSRLENSVAAQPDNIHRRAVSQYVPIEETALHIAIQGGDVDLVRLLVHSGADVGQYRLQGGAHQSTVELCAGDSLLLDALSSKLKERLRISPGRHDTREANATSYILHSSGPTATLNASSNKSQGSPRDLEMPEVVGDPKTTWNASPKRSQASLRNLEMPEVVMLTRTPVAMEKSSCSSGELMQLKPPKQVEAELAALESPDQFEGTRAVVERKPAPTERPLDSLRRPRHCTFGVASRPAVLRAHPLSRASASSQSQPVLPNLVAAQNLRKARPKETISRDAKYQKLQKLPSMFFGRGEFIL